jgi:endonuclease/exonuclease/phosphatase family metal-dependent hydrolase
MFKLLFFLVRLSFRLGVIGALVLAFIVGILLNLPRADWEREEEEFFRTYQTLTTNISGTDLLDGEDQTGPTSSSSSIPPLSVMSYNIRIDAEEPNPKNHWTRRVSRVAKTINRWRPAIIGLQEPSGGQVAHLLAKLEPEDKAVYRVLGYNRKSPDGPVLNPSPASDSDLVHPAHQWDYRVAVMYREDKLTLLEADYLWISNTPRVPESKDWGSGGPRSVAIARFALKESSQVNRIKKDKEEEGAGQATPTTSNPQQEIIVFNTHLDVSSESGRRGQSRFLITTIMQWASKYPHAGIILTGDFNACPGHAPHRTLLSNPRLLRDTWEVCSSANRLKEFAGERSDQMVDGGAQGEGEGHDVPKSCVVRTSTGVSFHGFFGAKAQSYLARIPQSLLFMVHAMGMEIPYHIPRGLREIIRAARRMWNSLATFPLEESVPKHWADLSRFHVDWILFGEGRGEGLGPTDANPRGVAVTKLTPLFIAVVDVKRKGFSSDHFPVVAVYDVHSNRHW